MNLRKLNLKIPLPRFIVQSMNEDIIFNPDPLIRFRGEVSKSKTARKLGVSPQVYRLWEGGTCPDGKNLYKIVKTLGIPLEDLFHARPKTSAPQQSAETALAA